jgi:hypothetical protein
MLLGYLLSVIVFSLSLTTTLNLISNYSIILLKANTIVLSIVIRSLEEGLSSLKDLVVSYRITSCSYSIVVLIEGIVNQLVKDVAGLAEIYFNLFCVRTRIILERA